VASVYWDNQIDFIEGKAFSWEATVEEIEKLY